MLHDGTYRQRADLRLDVDESGWARVRRVGAPGGIVLDPHVYRIWSAAGGGTLTGAAAHAQVSTYLAACAVALLQRAGLLARPADEAGAPADGSSDTTPGVQPSGAPRVTSGIPAIIVHHHAAADLDACLQSLAEQGDGLVGETRVLACAALPGEVRPGLVAECRPDGLAAALGEELGRTSGEAVLLLDSQVQLGSGALAEMAHILNLRADLAAVAPRVMWRAWPAVVVSLGDWRTGTGETAVGPHLGLLDVGQFVHRWRETPGVSFQAVLLRTTAVQRVGVAAGAGTLDELGAAWSRQVRQCGYRTLVALRAVAYGPWPAEQAAASTPALTRDGMPALTVDNIRGVYCHCPGVPPVEVRPRVALVATDGPHTATVRRALAATCEVDRVEPDPGDEALLREQLRDADVIVASAEAMEQIVFLQSWPGAILLDAPPGQPGTRAAAALLQQVDGAICVRQPIAGSVPRPEPGDASSGADGAWVMTTGGDRAAGSGVERRPGVVPLADFCRQPMMAPGREIGAGLGPEAVQPSPPPPTPLRSLPAKAWQVLRQRGMGDTVREVGRYVRWKVGV